MLLFPCFSLPPRGPHTLGDVSLSATSSPFCTVSLHGQCFKKDENDRKTWLSMRHDLPASSVTCHFAPCFGCRVLFHFNMFNERVECNGIRTCRSCSGDLGILWEAWRAWDDGFGACYTNF